MYPRELQMKDMLLSSRYGHVYLRSPSDDQKCTAVHFSSLVVSRIIRNLRVLIVSEFVINNL